MGDPVRIVVCDTAGNICVPVHFRAELLGGAIHIDTEDVNEFVAAIHTADDELQSKTDQYNDEG